MSLRQANKVKLADSRPVAQAHTFLLFNPASSSSNSSSWGFLGEAGEAVACTVRIPIQHAMGVLNNPLQCEIQL